MGSILSFPLLCLANLGVYLLTTKWLQESWSFEERLNSVLINGDDMLYCAPPDLWPLHEEIGNKVGLKMSLGKAYHHPVYSNVNSVSCHYNLKVRDESTPWQINFLNTGLYYGQHKVQDRVEGAEAQEHSSTADLSAVSCINVLLAGSLPGRQKDLLKKYLIQHKDSIQELSRFRINGKDFARNLFLPITCGGMGVDAPYGWKFSVSSHQKMLYNKLFPEYSCSSLPLPGYPVESKDIIIGTPWNKFKVEKPDELDFISLYDKDIDPKVYRCSRYKLLFPLIPYHPSSSVKLIDPGQPGASKNNFSFPSVEKVHEDMFVENYYEIISTWGLKL